MALSIHVTEGTFRRFVFLGESRHTAITGRSWNVAKQNLEKSAQRGANDGPRAWHFCTPVHRFAQRFDHILIDGANGKHYLAREIEPGS